MGSKLAALIAVCVFACFGCKGDEGKLEDAKSPDASYKAPGADPSAKAQKPLGTAVNPLDVK